MAAPMIVLQESLKTLGSASSTEEATVKGLIAGATIILSRASAENGVVSFAFNGFMAAAY